MGFCSQFKALLKKNFIMWYRNLCGSLCEILFPVLLVIINVIVRSLVKDETVPETNYLGNNFGYYFDNSASLSENVWNKLNEGNPFSICLYYNRLLLGIVADGQLYDDVKNELESSIRSISFLIN